MARHDRKSKAQAEERGQRLWEQRRAEKLSQQLKPGEFREGVLRTLGQDKDQTK